MKCGAADRYHSGTNVTSIYCVEFFFKTKEGSMLGAAEPEKANESRWVAGVRARHGQGAGRAGAVEADGEGCPDALERYVRVACVSLCRSVSSHENARVPHTAVPWQALGSLQAVFHESTTSIPSLRDS